MRCEGKARGKGTGTGVKDLISIKCFSSRDRTNIEKRNIVEGREIEMVRVIIIIKILSVQ